MVVKMMRWPPWPPLSSRKFEAKVIIHKLQGLNLVQDVEQNNDESKKRLMVEMKWKGQKGIALRRSSKRNFTEEGTFCGDGVFEWNEEFKSVCNLSGNKDGVFLPWEIAFAVFSGLKQGPRTKVILVGTATLNLAEYASTAKESEAKIDVPLTVHNGTVEGTPLLHLSLKLMELRTIQEPLQAPQRVIETAPPSPSSLETLSPRRDEPVLKAGLRKVKCFQVTKKACHEENNYDTCCVRSEDAEDNYPFDTDSLENDGESEESNGDSSAQLSFNYETLGHANKAGGSFYSNAITNAEDESWVYYNHRKQDMGSLYVESSTASDHEQSLRQSSIRGILAWRKRKLSFISAKPKSKGEPLLKKDCGEGGDDIDFDRRQLSSSDESGSGWNKLEEGSTTSRSSFSEFGDDKFAVGSWEAKEVISRDGHMKLQAQVFFASIDQRSERAAGESACTALVAVIANWLQSNQYEVPIKSEFDSLIRVGSLEWRNLCEREDYRQRFPDKHFDLETILQAKIRPLSVVPEKSFIGFFHPEGLEEGDFDFLHGAMSFDSIWQEINHHGLDSSSNCDPFVYIVSWNDHFFVLKVEQDAYYIIDTLGERLYEGCNQAYVLKFDKDTTIRKLPMETTESDEKTAGNKAQPSSSKEKTRAERRPPSSPNECEKTPMEEEIVCEGKESCKEYIKSFLAAIPIRELRADIKKGLMASTPLHHRLQIEFHYTQLTQPVDENSSRDVTIC
ncbi:hypothetical protein POTOM_030794 [Populus tomentosa]|uniref:C2 NT-type domain-containing protein n=1 Tax=Populus tomentosa TaxID=118781 RepID=A0A8X7Z764_POPTO|nr:hypothetical protein POTOM_030794 [Populus tomentosa]